MSSEFGKTLRVGVFGQSHGRAIGVTMDGLPAGEAIDFDQLHAFLERRRPGRSALSTGRREADEPVFLAGLFDGKTTGSPLCAVIENRDARSGDYAEFLDKPRPGHADYTAHVKWAGQADMRGGGHFSGRLTAPLCIAGGIAKQLLARKNIFVGAHLSAVADVADQPFPLLPTQTLFDGIAAKPFPAIDDAQGERMQSAILAAAADGDSVGGVIECAAIGLPAGLGEPMFGGMENRLSAALFGIPP
jgi:chorismate synthase